MTASEVAALQETAVPANAKKNTREMSNLLEAMQCIIGERERPRGDGLVVYSILLLSSAYSMPSPLFCSL